MATTVTYKGQTLATVDNQTKTLQTAGTWVEDDFTLTDVSGGGGTPTIGTHKVELGQYTPTATGSFTIPTDISTTSTLVWACVWLADASVLSNYSTDNIMTFSGFPISGGMKLINMWQSGVSKVEIKSAFGLTARNSGNKRALFYESHANWPGQPETYNYMAVYD